MAMSDEDVELRELLVANLESRGILSKIKAELRAAIFQCLDEKPSTDGKKSDNEKLHLSLIADSLSKLGLQNTLKVFDSSTHKTVKIDNSSKIMRMA